MLRVNYLVGGGKFDLLKFILAILIVLLHTRPLSKDFQPILRIAVPLFFIMTSFFFFNKIKYMSKNEANSALFHFVKRNLKLYLFWFIVLLPITWIRQDWFVDGAFEGLLHIIRNFFLGSTFAASWFLMASVIGVSITLFLSRYINNKWLLAFSFACYLFCSFDANYHHLLCSSPIIDKVYAIYHKLFGTPYISFPSAMLWVALGKLIAEHQIKVAKINCYVALIFACALLYFEHFYCYHQGWVLDDDCYLSLAIVCPLLFLTVSQHSFEFKFSKQARKISTIMYCFHLSLLTLLNIVFPLFDYNPNRWLTFGMCFICSFSVALLILMLESKSRIKFLKYAY